LTRGPQADISIFGAGRGVDLSIVQEHVELTMSACLFCRDGGQENALA